MGKKSRKLEKILLGVLLLLLIWLMPISAAAEETKEEPYEIVIELLCSAANPDADLVAERISRITEEKLGCRIRFHETEIAAHSTLIRQISDENRIDIVSCAITSTLSDMKGLGIIIDITDLLSQDAPGLIRSCGQLLDACKVGDAICCLPGNMYPAAQTSLLYSEELTEKYGVAPPEEPISGYEELEDFYEKIKESDYRGYAASSGDGFRLLYLPEKLETFGDPYNYSFGVLDSNGQGKIKNLYDLDLFEEHCRVMADWRDKGYLDPDSILTDTTLVQALMEDTVCTSIQSLGSDPFYYNQMTGRTYRVLPLEPLQVLTENVVPYGMAVTSASERPDLCVKFLELVYTDPEVMNLLNYGIENQHYRKVSEHIISPILEEDGLCGYGNLIALFGDASLRYQKEPATEEYFDELSAYRIDQAQISPTFGYTFDPGPVGAQTASVRNVIDLYRPGLACGAADLDTLLPLFREALHEAGIDEIIAENQRQYDLWKSQR